MPSAIWSSVATQPKPHRQACARDSIHFKGGKSADEGDGSQLVTLSAFSRGECSGQQALCGDGCSGPSAERTGAKLLETAELSLCGIGPRLSTIMSIGEGLAGRVLHDIAGWNALGSPRPRKAARSSLDWRIGRNPKAISPLMRAGRNNSCLDGDFPPSSLGPPNGPRRSPATRCAPRHHWGLLKQGQPMSNGWRTALSRCRRSVAVKLAGNRRYAVADAPAQVRNEPARSSLKCGRRSR